MDPQTHWQTIQTELIIKSIEGLLELRLYQKQQFRRTNSSCLNIVMQTMIAECSQIREEIYYNFTFPSSLSFVFSLGDTHIEKWSFLFSSLDKHPSTDLYQQASTSLRSLLCLSQLLPAYSLFLQGVDLKYSFSEIPDLNPKEKIKLILLKSPIGTLFLEVSYIKSPDNIASIPQIHIPSVHGSSTPPCIEWEAVSLSVSDSSSELSPPFSSLGNEIEFFEPKPLPRYLMEDEDIPILPIKKERKSYDLSHIARECTKILNNFENILKDVEGNEEVMKEYYSLLFREDL